MFFWREKIAGKSKNRRQVELSRRRRHARGGRANEERRDGAGLGRDGRVELGVDRTARGVGVYVLEQHPDDVRVEEQPRLVVLGARRLDAGSATTRAHREELRYGRRGDDDAVQTEAERRTREVRQSVLRWADLALAEARVPGQRKAEASRAETRVAQVERAPANVRAGGNGEQRGGDHVRVRLFPRGKERLVVVLLDEAASGAAEDALDALQRRQAEPVSAVPAPHGAENVYRALRLGRRCAAALGLHVPRISAW